MKAWVQEVEKNDDRQKQRKNKKETTVSEALETWTACS